MSRPWVAQTLAGRTIRYASREALDRARTRRKDVIVDAWPENDPPPVHSSDADTWDRYRTRRGYAGGR